MELLSMLGSVVGLIVFLVVALLVPLVFRKVVETNMVHITQTKKKTTSYGAGQAAGNVYYNWPSWFPIIGITRTVFKVSNFDLSLHAYKAYDKERVPFELDVTSFFRISDTNTAAQRVSNFEELHKQLTAIVQGAVRKILASHDINQIMIDRATFGEAFTNEVKTELLNWGVEPVKNMELMDIRDADGSNVIANIMAKKSSHIEMESRVEVANNMQVAQTAEINAKQTVDIRTQEAEQAVGQRTADKNRQVGIAEQRAEQDVKAEQKVTMERSMAVREVEQVRQAEIARAAAVVHAEQGRQTTVIDAEGKLAATQRLAEGIRVEGQAKADAETAMQLAPVNAQITLAKEIGQNEGYQRYLVSIETVDANKVVGVAQAEALKVADIKVIANAGEVPSGVKSAMDLFSTKGGTALGGALEALAQTPQGALLMNALTGGKSHTPTTDADTKATSRTPRRANGADGEASAS